MVNKFIFPQVCSVCLKETSSVRNLRSQSDSVQQGFSKVIIVFNCSVPVCDSCNKQFGRLNHGWRTWFVFLALGIVIGAMSKAFLSIFIIIAILGIIPSVIVAIRRSDETEDPVYLSKQDGTPVFSNKEYQRMFNNLNGLGNFMIPKVDPIKPVTQTIQKAKQIPFTESLTFKMGIDEETKKAIGKMNKSEAISYCRDKYNISIKDAKKLFDEIVLNNYN